MLDGRILPLRQLQCRREQIRRLDSKIEPVEREEVPHHEAGAGEQRNRERQFSNDERADQRNARAGGTEAAAFFQDFVDVGLRDVQRRREPK